MGTLQDLFSCFYELEESNGSRVDRVLANANDLTDANGVTQNTGKIGHCGQFVILSGSSLLRASNASLQWGDIGAFVHAWVYLDSKPAAANQGIITKDNFADREYALMYEQSSDRFRWSIYGSVGGGDAVTVKADVLGSPSLATWYQVLGIHDPVANTSAIWVNGRMDTSAAATAGVYAGASNFRVGGFSAGTSTFDGRIDQAGMGKAVPSLQQIQTLYNAGNALSWAQMSGVGQQVGHKRNSLLVVP